MKKNDIITLEITAIVNSGHGLGRYEGIVIFVPYSAVGDVLRVRLLKVMSSYAYGRIEEIVAPSPRRIPPECSVFGKCGGCDFRHMDYSSELEAKESFIRDTFTRIGGLSPEFLPIIPNNKITEYRNKAQYPVGKGKDGKPFYGFYRSNSHDIVACEKGCGCAIQPHIFSRIADFIIDFAAKNSISIYCEEEHKGVLRHIFLRKGHYSGEICAVIVARRRIPEFMYLAKALMKAFSEIKGVVLNINKEKTNVVLGSEEQVLCGSGVISDVMCGVKTEISPKSFYQINTPAAERIYAEAREFIQPSGKTVLDLYCGAGTIGLSLASEAKEVIGVEISEPAVENARANAEKNNAANVRFICADAKDGVMRLINEGAEIDAIVLDPSRKGCGSDAIEQIAKLAPVRIVMISCNPVTAASDCGSLARCGYRTLKVRGADLFSRTKHVECVVLLERPAGTLPGLCPEPRRGSAPNPAIF